MPLSDQIDEFQIDPGGIGDDRFQVVVVHKVEIIAKRPGAKIRVEQVNPRCGILGRLGQYMSKRRSDHAGAGAADGRDHGMHPAVARSGARRMGRNHVDQCPALEWLLQPVIAVQAEEQPQHVIRQVFGNHDERNVPIAGAKREKLRLLQQCPIVDVENDQIELRRIEPLLFPRAPSARDGGHRTAKATRTYRA